MSGDDVGGGLDTVLIQADEEGEKVYDPRLQRDRKKEKRGERAADSCSRPQHV